MFDPSYLYWFAWLVVFFLPKELWAAFATKMRKDTFSEFVWFTFDNKVKKVALAGFLCYLQGHFLWQWPGEGVILLGLPVGLIITRRMVVETQKQYSLKIGGKQVVQHLVEIGSAFIIALAPQLVELALNVAQSTPPEQLHIPAAWTVFWIAAVRFANNWWKNRK